MPSRNIAAIAFALAVGAAPGARATELLMFHSWSNDSEINALNVIVEAFEARGHTIKEISVPHESEVGSPLTNLVIAGTPPNVFIEANADFYRDLRDQGLGQAVDDLMAKVGATDAFPPTVLKAITIDGEIRKIPTAVHIDGMIYYNKEVAEAAGVDPTSWTSIDDMFADIEKVQDAGFNFMAMGGNTFQAGYLFHALVAAVAGPDIYNRFYAGTPDPTVFEEEGLKDAIAVFRRITDQADEGWVNRSWADTTNTVISGQTLMHLHGDWMKGQWRASGKEVGVDFGCINIPGTKALSVTVDSFGILGGVDEETLAAEKEFASIVVDPEINAKFASFKGSSPVRLDVPTNDLDECNTLVLESLRGADKSVQNPFYIGDTDWINSVWNVMFTFQGDPSMTTDDVIDMLEEEREAIFG